MNQGTISPIRAAENPIDPGVRIGHVHLRTADIDRVREFYVGVLGLPDGVAGLHHVAINYPTEPPPPSRS